MSVCGFDVFIDSLIRHQEFDHNTNTTKSTMQLSSSPSPSLPLGPNELVGIALGENRKLSEELHEAELALEDRIIRNKALQKQLCSLINRQDERSVSWTFFPSTHGYLLTIPENEDQKAKSEAKLKDQKIGPWSKNEMLTLRAAVGIWMKEQLIARLRNKLISPKVLETSPNSARETAIKFDQLTEQIRSLSIETVYRLTSLPSDQDVFDEEEYDELDRETKELLQGPIAINWSEVRKLGSKDGLLNRTDVDADIIWKNKVRPGLNRSEWKKREDVKLLKAAESGSQRDWQKIAQSVPGRMPFQCLMRYQRSLNPELLKKNWTEEEDEQLMDLVKKHGASNWQYIAAEMECRTGQQCLHRYTKALNPSIKKGKWTDEEDKRLALSVYYFGNGSWTKVAQHVPNRTDMQCRERWENVLTPDVKMTRFSEEEDQQLLDLVAQLKLQVRVEFCYHLCDCSKTIPESATTGKRLDD